MKKLLAIILCVVICAALTTTAFSAYVTDSQISYNPLLAICFDPFAGTEDIPNFRTDYIAVSHVFDPVNYPSLVDQPHTVGFGTGTTPDSTKVGKWEATFAEGVDNTIYVYTNFHEKSDGLYVSDPVWVYKYDPDNADLVRLFDLLNDLSEQVSVFVK